MATFFNPEKSKQKKKKHLTLTVEKLDHELQGIARFQKQTVFLTGVLPSEVVQVEVPLKKGAVQGKVKKWVQRSESRIEPWCPHNESCGGCQTQYLSADMQVNEKQTAIDSLLKHVLKINDELPWQDPLRSNELSYRRRARLGVCYDKASRSYHVGFRATGEKKISPIKRCGVLVKPFQDLPLWLAETLGHTKVRSALTHVEMIHADRAVLILRHTDTVSVEDKATINESAKQHDIELWGLDNENRLTCWNDPNSVLQLSYILPDQGITLFFESSDFIQVNELVNQKMVTQALDWLQPNADDQILDLFSGVGNFSLPLAKSAKRVIAVEGMPEMVEKASKNAGLNQLSNVSFYHDNLFEDFRKAKWYNEMTDITKVLLDPARAGAQLACEILSEGKIPHILYVSCNPQTLARDVTSFINKKYRIKKLGIIDMFPHTSHIETMVLFEKENLG